MKKKYKTNSLISLAVDLGYSHYTENTIEQLDIMAPQAYDKVIELNFLQKWLRDKHSIFVWPMINVVTKKFGWEIWDDKKEDSSSYKPNSDDWDFDTWEIALEHGLREGLILIK